MSGLLKGELQPEASRADLEETARYISADYFGTDCVNVRLFKQELRNEGGFTAKFEARVEHLIELPEYGPGICQICDKKFWSRDFTPEPSEWSDDE